MSNEHLEKEKYVYLCKTDWGWHIPDDIDGVTIYSSIKNLKDARECVDTCGIVRCKIVFDNVVQNGTGFCKEKLDNEAN